MLIDPVSLYSLLSLMLMCIFIVLSHSAFLFLIIVLTAEVFPKTIFIKFPSPRALFKSVVLPYLLSGDDESLKVQQKTLKTRNG